MCELPTILIEEIDMTEQEKLEEEKIEREKELLQKLDMVDASTNRLIEAIKELTYQLVMK